MSENKNENEIIVSGFSFADEAEAEQAKKEAEGVLFIRERTDMDNPEMVFDIYNKMIQQSLFETAVGFSYLKELQEYLQSIPFIKKEDIPSIPIRHPALEASLRRSVRRQSARMKQEQERQKPQEANVDYKNRFRVMRGLCIVLTVCIVGMFVVTATTNNTTILNYEQELINRYEEWEAELDEREAAILEREEELGMQEE